MASARVAGGAATAIRRRLAPAATNPVLFAAHGLRYRKVEVILTTTIDKLGKAGEVVKVAPGHFRNYLMPRMLAVPNIDKFTLLVCEQQKLHQHKEEDMLKEVAKADDVIQEEEEKKKKEKKKEYQKAALRLSNTALDVSVAMCITKYMPVVTGGSAHMLPVAACRIVGGNTGVFRRFIKVGNEICEPVTKDEIISEVARQLYVSIHPYNVHLPKPLESLGEFEVLLRLPRDMPLPEGMLRWALKIKIRRK